MKKQKHWNFKDLAGFEATNSRCYPPRCYSGIEDSRICLDSSLWTKILAVRVLGWGERWNRERWCSSSYLEIRGHAGQGRPCSKVGNAVEWTCDMVRWGDTWVSTLSPFISHQAQLGAKVSNRGCRTWPTVPVMGWVVTPKIHLLTS